ncbi:MAG TPA: alginate export family protein [Phenylobacterium sp.]
MAAIRRSAWLAGAALCILTGTAQAQETSLVDAIAAGKPILEIRPRYETVDQANFAREAEQLSVRTRLGWETGTWHDLKALIEFENVSDLAGEDYNSTLNGRVLYPVISDPEVTELNRLQLTWTPSKAFSATLGRQRILFDDQRFIGNVGWRQDEQTFDALRTDFTVGKVKAAVVYVDRVNRIFAEKADWNSDSWLVNVAYAGPDTFKPSAFVYALDFSNSPLNSSLTTGVRVAGKTKVGDIGVGYAGSYAHQTDHANNPLNFDLDYWAGELSGTAGIVTVRGAYESLEGNGVRGFSTPLATLHAFQGWADVFLTTPPNGIEDANIGVTVRPKWKAPHLFNIELTARYHSFEAERGGADLGEEFDLLAAAAITKQLTGLIKFADYDGVPGFPSRRKLWVGFEFKL